MPRQQAPPDPVLYDDRRTLAATRATLDCDDDPALMLDVAADLVDAAQRLTKPAPGDTRVGFENAAAVLIWCRLAIRR